ncbi:MAG: bifunctional phosphoribosylaminoimidazolecarboxamide formyltransferase/IMP cyclohydrolase [Chitinophagaceae bacterium]
MKKINSALISVFYKDGLLPLAQSLVANKITIYSTGGTLQFLQDNGINCIGVETVTNYPSIFGGRVKTLHPKVFGGILFRRNETQDVQEKNTFEVPEIDLVIVDLYPFEETVANTKEEKLIIEKIDIGGPSMLRAAAKNFNDVLVVASKNDYQEVTSLLSEQQGATTIEQRKAFAAKAFKVVMDYDVAISNYFNTQTTPLRYGENPHQQATFTGNLEKLFTQLHGKELSYNNLVDVDGALQLLQDVQQVQNNYHFFGIIKHTNTCGAALASSTFEAWQLALAGDPESAFGGILVCSNAIDVATANAINDIFFEVLIAPSFDADALAILQTKKNRILLQLQPSFKLNSSQAKSLLNGTIHQQNDEGNYSEWNEVGGRATTEIEKTNLAFANIVCKHLKSNAIAIVTNHQLIGKGCGQTSRIDALKHALTKAQQFNFNLQNAVLASDAFFPFSDCVQLAHQAGITAFIQPGGSIRDKDSIDYCVANNLAMVMSGLRHFKH